MSALKKCRIESLIELHQIELWIASNLIVLNMQKSFLNQIQSFLKDSQLYKTQILLSTCWKTLPSSSFCTACTLCLNYHIKSTHYLSTLALWEQSASQVKLKVNYFSNVKLIFLTQFIVRGLQKIYHSWVYPAQNCKHGAYQVLGYSESLGRG